MKSNIQIGIVALALLIGLAGCAAYLPGDDEQTAYDSMPENTNFVLEADVLGLAQDDTTIDIIEGVGQEFGFPQGFYESELDVFIDNFNEDLDNRIETVDVDVQTVERIYVFGEMETSIEELEEQSEDTDDIGFLIEVDLTEEELYRLSEDMEDEMEITELEYNEHSIYYEESSNEWDSDTYITILNAELGLIAITEDREYMESIIDTNVGDSNSMNTEILPEGSQDAYLSLGIGETEELFTEFQTELESVENDPIFDNLDDNEKALVQQFNSSPSPKSVGMTYYTDGSEVNLDISMDLDTSEAATEWEQILDNDSENIDISVSVDTTTVTVNMSATSESVVDEIAKQLDEFQNIYDSPDQQDDIDSTTSEARAFITFDETVGEKVEIQLVTIQTADSVWVDAFDGEAGSYESDGVESTDNNSDLGGSAEFGPNADGDGDQQYLLTRGENEFAGGVGTIVTVEVDDSGPENISVFGEVNGDLTILETYTLSE